MKILQIGKFYYPHLGGIETVVKTLSEGLIKKGGYAVNVLCASSRNKLESIVEHNVPINGVTISRAWSMGLLFSQPITPMLPFHILRLSKQADILHMHSPNPLAEAALALLPLRKPIVVTYHSDVIRQRLLLPAYLPVLRMFLRKVRKIIVATPYHIEFSAVLHDFQEKCKIIPFGIEQQPFEYTPEVAELSEDIRRQYGDFILYLGRMVGYKGLDVLINALNKTKSIRAVLIGEGPLRADLEQRVKDDGLADRIHFLGEIHDHKKVVSHIYASRLVVLPSVTKNEAFGMAVVEAMACGKPIISTRVDSGFRFVNEDGITGLQVEPGDSEALSHAIEKMMTDKPLLKKMGTAARERFNNFFSAEKMVQAHENVYRETLAGR
ncbi:MAG: glycosyltransferase [Candidatus Poribacteria bacterium]